MNNGAVILRLVIAHFLGDFVFQTKKIVEDKKRKVWKSYWLYFHCLLYAILVYLALSKWGQFYMVIPFIFLSHLIIDGYKSSKPDKAVYFFLDQISHFMILAVLFLYYSKDGISDSLTIVKKIWISPRILGILAGFIIITLPVGRLIGFMTRNLRERLKDNEDIRGLANAGLWIGCLERLFIFLFIITENTEAIAFLIAVKSIFRFGEIKEAKNRPETEYILIGTLLSFFIAMVIGYGVRYAP